MTCPSSSSAAIVTVDEVLMTGTIRTESCEIPVTLTNKKMAEGTCDRVAGGVCGVSQGFGAR